tara:strand:- start:541 stop:1383 length:843 start_codon:yes stop_codon:yes gene_type:complete
MSWTGTVHCSYCGKRGHNRLGCPARRGDARENPDGYLAKQIKREEETRRQAVEARRCSYCGEKGHNRRGCTLLKEDKNLIISRQKDYRRDFAASLTARGITPGSLVRVDQSATDQQSWEKGYLALVTNVLWKNVDFLMKDAPGYNIYSSPKISTLVQGRVVSVFGYTASDAERSHWYGGEPSFNDSIGLTPAQVVCLAPEIMHEKSLEQCRTSKARLEVVSRSSVAISASFDNLLTKSISESFNLSPPKNSGVWQKRRISLTGTQWSTIRREEHEKAREN